MAYKCAHFIREIRFIIGKKINQTCDDVGEKLGEGGQYDPLPFSGNKPFLERFDVMVRKNDVMAEIGRPQSVW